MTTAVSTAYTRALGARLLSEANDIKRTPESLAAELGVPCDRIAHAIEGALSPAEYRELFSSVAARYPISFARLWLEPTDGIAGVVHMTAAQSEASSRVFTRADRSGRQTPYYEYRDTAMSRVAPFRPEWIRELRVVEDADPASPDVAYNKGHLLHQTTLFIGPVNFYWEIDGVKRVAELNTGDSNYITPYWPHSFASRDDNELALIIAVTYGGEVARGREELSRLGAAALPQVTLEMRKAAAAYGDLLRRHVANEALSPAQFVEAAAAAGVDPQRVKALAAGEGVPTPAEVACFADVLSVSARDLMPPIRTREDEVVVRRRHESAPRRYPADGAGAYEITALARSRQQPYLKSFLVRVLPTAGPAAPLQVMLHQYLYNLGDEAVRLTSRSRDEEADVEIAPGDSAYISPLTEIRLSVTGRRPADLYMVRVPGDLHADAVFELSSMAPSGLARVAGETTRWF
jgi:hypothetical protein